jgi:uncharacterized repeat protein (TIGR01451 family)
MQSILFTRYSLIGILGLLFTFSASAQNCSPDVDAPTANCLAGLQFPLGISGPGTTTIWSTDLDGGSFDFCTPVNQLDFRIELGNTPSNDPPADISYSFTSSDDHEVVIWVGDAAGNWSTCLTHVEITNDPPYFDTIAPLAVCNENSIFANLSNGTVTVSAELFDNGSYDNFPGPLDFRIAEIPSGTPPATTELTFTTTGSKTIFLYAIDQVGNFDICTSTLVVTEYDCTNDTDPPIAVCDAGLVVELGSDGPGQTILWASDVDNGSWDQCSTVELTIELGNPSQDPPNTPAVILTEPGNFQAVLWVTDSVGNSNTCWALIQVLESTQCYDWFIQGNVFLDTGVLNCSLDAQEDGLDNWEVEARSLTSGRVYNTFTDFNGDYLLGLCAQDTIIEIYLTQPYDYSENCQGVDTIFLSSPTNTLGDTLQKDIPVRLVSYCPLLSVDISAPLLRRCFENSYYIQACNLSTETVPDVYVEVHLDSWFSPSQFSHPQTALGSNVFQFSLGNLPPGHCETIEITGTLSCLAALGETHCAEAYIFPDTLCSEGGAWQGADVRVNAQCDGDSVRLHILNNGPGNMTELLDFIVVEDVIMYQEGQFLLDSGNQTELTVPANGATWHLQAEQVEGHPYGGPEAIAIEGCGGINTPGVLNILSVGSPNPYNSIFCLQNIGSYDPNDKQAFPVGYGPEHLIEPGTPIRYHIRFQNTGTDTAFTVEILDTLSSFLDPSTVRPGAASHPYSYQQLDGGVLRFRFENIMLPDSNVNEPGSHGFIQFVVDQTVNNPLGSVIQNDAAIYFDFNDPVITNTAFHTLGDHFISVSWKDQAVENAIFLYPNPATDFVVFQTNLAAIKEFKLINSIGQVVEIARPNAETFRFERGTLPDGQYFFTIQLANNQQFAGTLILH